MWLSLLFVLVLSGFFTYFVLRQTVSQMTAAPLWILWAILMLPPLLTGATITWSKQIPPIPVAIALCSICWLLYWRLLEWGRPKPRSIVGTQSAPDPTDIPSGALEPSAPLVEPDPEVVPIVRPIEAEEESILRTCFAWNIFFLDKIEYRPQAVLCRGKLRTDPDRAYASISQNITDLFGDRFFILFQYSLSTGKPFFALVPRPQYTQITQSRRWIDYAISILLVLATLVSTIYFGAALARLQQGQITDIITAGLPYALSIVSILGLRDLGRYFVAKFYQIDTSLPYFIPLPFLPGTYGCLVQIRSPIPHRKAVFDLGFIASTIGLLTSIPLLIWGLSQSETVPLDPKSTLFNFHAFNPRFSLLLTLLSKLALGSQFGAERAIDLNNIAVAAYISLLIVAINLMPLWRLDGGYIVHAMFGQKPSAIVSQISKLLLLILGFLRFRASGFINTDLLFLAIAISLIPAIDEPALNDVSELDRWRDMLGVIILAFLVLTLIPVPMVLMQLLNV